MGFNTEKNRIEYEEGGKMLAEILFPDSSDGVVDITRTFVDEVLRGQGMAGKLMQRAAEEIRATNRRAIPSCSYAVKWFGEHDEYKDILA